MPEQGNRRPVSPERAAYFRRAAALLSHWQRKGAGVAGEMAIFAEMKSDQDWTRLVCALLDLTEQLVVAARDGREAWFLDHVLREAMLDEAATRGGKSR